MIAPNRQRTRRRGSIPAESYGGPPIHPGEILREEFLGPAGMSAYALAKAMGVPQTRLSQILTGKRSVTAETALRLAAALKTTAQFWMNLQSAYDLDVTADRLKVPREHVVSS